MHALSSQAAASLSGTASGLAGQLGNAVPASARVALPVTGAAAGGSLTVIHQTNHYPVAEPTSKATNKALQYASTVGLT
jgi:hypothetical protein